MGLDGGTDCNGFRRVVHRSDGCAVPVPIVIVDMGCIPFVGRS
jgi:hypothetical protein